MKKLQERIITVIIALIVLSLLAVYVSTHYARENFSRSIRNIPQNALFWLDPKTKNRALFTNTEEQTLSKNYLKHYFSPWTVEKSISLQFKPVIKETIRNYIDYPGYGINHLPNSPQWVEHIAKNIDLAHFPNAHSNVITVMNTNMRNLPTHQPSFGNFHQAGQGYPFDNLQVTSIAPNTPAVLIDKTRDGAWSFIVTHNTDGWVPTTALATVDNQFIHQWETAHFVTLIKDKVTIEDSNKIMRFRADIGKIFPIIKNKTANSAYAILIAVPSSNRQAVIKTGYLNKTLAAPWPIKATQYHIATLMNAMLGVKYGWGGITSDSDCSLTTMNLFSAFGIDLPRNSTLQSFAGHSINLLHLSDREKEKMIFSRGIPYVTLLHMPGHITVYIGKKDGRVIIFQTVWGVETESPMGKRGRAIIGTTVITPANLGENDINVTRTWLHRMDKMVLLAN